MKQICICNDHITGIFSGIYDIWKVAKDEEHAGIMLKGCLEQRLFCEYVEVVESEKKAAAVSKMIHKNLGEQVYFDIYQAILAKDARKGDAILGTLLEAKRIPNGRKIMEHLSNENVERVFELSRKVSREAHVLKGFIRFRELKNGVLFAEIEPKSQILTCIADHFSNRFPLENFMIYDRTHKMFLVHQAQCRWALVHNEDVNAEMTGAISENQKKFEVLWKGFCKTISIRERENFLLQKQNLPLRYRQDMVEFIQ